MKKARLLVISFLMFPLFSSCSQSLKAYEVTWLNDDESVISVTKVLYGELPVQTTSESKTSPSIGHHMSFNGWENIQDGNKLSQDFKMPEHNITFKALFNEDANEHFVYWINQKSEIYSNDYLMPDEDIIFTSIYTEKINKYTATWKDDSGALIGTTYVDLTFLDLSQAEHIVMLGGNPFFSVIMAFLEIHVKKESLDKYKATYTDYATNFIGV